MSIIYQNDPKAQEKLRRRLKDLQRELTIVREQDKMAKYTGDPKNPRHIADSLRSRIHQTKRRLEAFGGERGDIFDGRGDQ